MEEKKISVIVNSSRQHGKSTMLLLARELVHKQREVESLQYANRRLKAALKDMCELWESMGTQIPPLLNEQKYLNAKAIVGTDTNVPANAPDTNVGTKGGK